MYNAPSGVTCAYAWATSDGLRGASLFSRNPWRKLDCRPCPDRDVEADEVWSFIGKKEKRVRPEDDQNLGDCYTFVAIERHSKLVLNIAMGKRNQATTDQFIEGVRHATAHSRFQITTDGFGPYKSAIWNTLHDRCDFAQLIKIYSNSQDARSDIAPPKSARLR